MQAVVADIQLENTNYLTLNRVYSKIGTTELLGADPQVMHFGGFQLGQTYTQVLRICNTSTSATRIHIIPPTTPFFKVRDLLITCIACLMHTHTHTLSAFLRSLPSRGMAT